MVSVVNQEYQQESIVDGFCFYDSLATQLLEAAEPTKQLSTTICIYVPMLSFWIGLETRCGFRANATPANIVYSVGDHYTNVVEMLLGFGLWFTK